jgi:integrase
LCGKGAAENLEDSQRILGGFLRRSVLPGSARGSASLFQAAVRKSNVQKITLHDLRHTCASLAVSAGVNVLALQRMLGHTSAKVTLDTYADLFDDDLDEVAVTLHGRYSSRNVSTACPGSPPSGIQKTYR